MTATLNPAALRTDQRRSETQAHPVGPQLLASDHRPLEAQRCNAAGDLLDPGQTLGATQSRPAGVEPSADDQPSCDTHWSAVVGTLSSQPPTNDLPRTNAAPSSGWLELRIWAEMFDDAQKQRIASVNRAERGGVDPAIYEAYIATLERAEHECLLAMRKCFRRVVPEPIKEWQKNTPGIGIDRLAKILGHLGHPVIATPHHWEGTGSNRELIADEPFARTVGQLWQYCGLGAPHRKRKGMTADELAAHGNPKLKSLLWNAANECMKCRTSPFRKVYDETREAVADKTHTAECVRCGPSGKPAQIGSAWSPGHQHAHALRIVSKEILRDLWIVAGGKVTAA